MNKFEQIGVNLQYDAMNKHSRLLGIPVSAVAQKVCGLTVSTVPFTTHIS